MPTKPSDCPCQITSLLAMWIARQSEPDTDFPTLGDLGGLARHALSVDTCFLVRSYPFS